MFDIVSGLFTPRMVMSNNTHWSLCWSVPYLPQWWLHETPTNHVVVLPPPQKKGLFVRFAFCSLSFPFTFISQLVAIHFLAQWRMQWFGAGGPRKIEGDAKRSDHRGRHSKQIPAGTCPGWRFVVLAGTWGHVSELLTLIILHPLSAYCPLFSILLSLTLSLSHSSGGMKMLLKHPIKAEIPYTAFCNTFRWNPQKSKLNKCGMIIIIFQGGNLPLIVLSIRSVICSLHCVFFPREIAEFWPGWPDVFTTKVDIALQNAGYSRQNVWHYKIKVKCTHMYWFWGILSFFNTTQWTDG